MLEKCSFCLRKSRTALNTQQAPNPDGVVRHDIDSDILKLTVRYWPKFSAVPEFALACYRPLARTTHLLSPGVNIVVGRACCRRRSVFQLVPLLDIESSQRAHEEPRSVSGLRTSLPSLRGISKFVFAIRNCMAYGVCLNGFCRTLALN